MNANTPQTMSTQPGTRSLMRFSPRQWEATGSIRVHSRAFAVLNSGRAPKRRWTECEEHGHHRSTRFPTTNYYGTTGIVKIEITLCLSPAAKVPQGSAKVGCTEVCEGCTEACEGCTERPAKVMQGGYKGSGPPELTRAPAPKNQRIKTTDGHR